MDIGIGKGNPICSLDIKGGFKTTTLKLTDTKIDGVTKTPVITAKDSGKIVTLAANAGAITLILPTPAAGLNYKFIIVATNSNAVTIKSSSDGTSGNVTALMMGSITVNNTTTNVELNCAGCRWF